MALLYLSINLYEIYPALAQSHYDETWTIARELDDQWIAALIVHIKGHWIETQANYEAARIAFEESMELFHSVGDMHWTAVLSADIAGLGLMQGDLEGARLRLEQNLSYFRETKNRVNISVTVTRLGEIARVENNFELARRYYLEGLAIARDLGSKPLIEVNIYNLGFVALHNEELDAARSFFVESLASKRELDSMRSLVYPLLGIASLAAVEMKAQQAVHLLGAIDEILKGEDAESLNQADKAEYQRYLALARQQLDETAFNVAWVEGQQMTLDQAIELVRKDIDNV